MKRPEHPILDKLAQSITRLHEAEKNLTEAKATLSNQAREISEVPGKQERIDLAIYAYWSMPEIPAADLAWATTKKEHASALLRLMSPVTMDIQCDGCGKEVPLTSRTQMKEAQERLRLNEVRWAEGYRVVCRDCTRKIFEDRRIEGDARDAAYAERYAQLRAMEYADYLKTTDWQRALQRHVNFARYERKSNSLRCEACSSEHAAGAYHKNFDHLGHEGSEDLIFLGERCLAIFTGNGLIVGCPSSEHLVSNCHATDLEIWSSED